MSEQERIRALARALAGSQPVALTSLKAAGGEPGGVSPRSTVHRVQFADGESAVLKDFEDEAAFLEERCNLRFLGEVTPEHAPRLLGSTEHALLLEDLGGQTLATLCLQRRGACAEGWLLWVDAVARVHASAQTNIERLGAIYAPDEPRVERAPPPTKLLGILCEVAITAHGLAISDDETAEVVGALRHLDQRLAAFTQRDTVFGFADPNPMNAVLVDGRVCFVDVGGPALGLAARAFSEVWRAPEPEALFRRYVDGRSRWGRAMAEDEFREERQMYGIASSIVWLGRHLAAAARGGIPDVDGRRDAYGIVEESNMRSILDLSSGHAALEPLRRLVSRVRAAPRRDAWS